MVKHLFHCFGFKECELKSHIQIKTLWVQFKTTDTSNLYHKSVVSGVSDWYICVDAYVGLSEECAGVNDSGMNIYDTYV